jgi:hypothetical protein
MDGQRVSGARATKAMWERCGELRPDDVGKSARTDRGVLTGESSPPKHVRCRIHSENGGCDSEQPGREWRRQSGRWCDHCVTTAVSSVQNHRKKGGDPQSTQWKARLPQRATGAGEMRLGKDVGSGQQETAAER